MSRLFRVALFVVVSLWGSISSSVWAEDLPQQVVATVNGKPIRAEQIQLQFFLESLPAESAPEVRQKLIAELIDRELVRQFLASRKIEADPVRLDQQLTVIQQVIAKQGEQVDDVLSKLHLDSASLREVLALPLAWEAYVQSVLTDKQLRDLWEKHRFELDGTRVQAAQIVRILPAEAKEADWKQAESLLSNLRNEIQSGKISFAAAAEMHSQSPSGKRGGDMGEFEYHGRVDDAISRVAFTTKPGEISLPFRTRSGVHLVQTRKIIPGQLSLEDARPELVSRISQQLWKQKIEELREQARIKINPVP